jgi:two-component system sensor histidine kinase EvgS
MDDFAAKPTTIPMLAGRLRRWLPQLEWPSRRVEPVGAAPGTAPGAPNGDGLLDPAMLDELTGGDADLAASLVADFVATTQADLRALEVALSARELDQVRRQAHRIKGAARIVGAHEIVGPAERIEALAGAANDDGDVDWPALGVFA